MYLWLLGLLLLGSVFGEIYEDGFVYEHEAWGYRIYERIFNARSFRYPNEAPGNLRQTWRYVVMPDYRDGKPAAVHFVCDRIYLPEESCKEYSFRIEDGDFTQVLCGNLGRFEYVSKTEDITFYLNTGPAGGGLVNCTSQAVLVGPGRDPIPTTTTTTPAPPPPPPPPLFLDQEFEDPDTSEAGMGPQTAPTSCACGWTNKPTQRIVNGKEAGMHEFPWMVALVSQGSWFPFCGGSIISESHVLTAAHCTRNHVASGSPMSVLVGDHDWNREDETDKTQYIDVERIIPHDEYNGRTTNDISLLVLKDSIKFSQYVGPVCLPGGPLDLGRSYVKVMGWGALGEGQGTPTTLRHVNLRAIPIEECRAVWGTYLIHGDTAHQLCTYSKDKGFCYGDSGGPIVWLDPETSRYTLVGMPSFVSQCANRMPGVSATPAAYVKWINKNVEETRRGTTLCRKLT